MSNVTTPVSVFASRFLMNPHATMSLPKSGSMIFRSLSNTASSDSVTLPELALSAALALTRKRCAGLAHPWARRECCTFSPSVNALA
eukprot:1195173-Prorocentrum_minimum.AAC.3